MLLPSTLPNKIGNHDCQFRLVYVLVIYLLLRISGSYIKVSAKTIALGFFGVCPKCSNDPKS
jgi:hypothetical protein